MENFNIYLPEIDYSFPMIFVKGTGDKNYLFGDEEKVGVYIHDFVISKYTVTQRFWQAVMGNNPSHFNGQDRPVECVSFNDITQTKGFLNELNSVAESKYKLKSTGAFRLPSETEWEYAARGGIHWTDGFQFSGSNEINDVGWYDQNSGNIMLPKSCLS